MAGGTCVAVGHACWGGLCMAGQMATAADSMHPTGMHSAFFFLKFIVITKQTDHYHNKIHDKNGFQ